MAGPRLPQALPGDSVVFYLMIASLVAPGLVLGIGVGLLFQCFGLEASWYTTALGAQLSWTLPFGVLVMFAVMSRLDTPGRRRHATSAPALAERSASSSSRSSPGHIAVALFGFTLSYDEFPRTLLTVGSHNTLPLEIWTMTLNVTSPSLYALGTVTTIASPSSSSAPASAPSR